MTSGIFHQLGARATDLQIISSSESLQGSSGGVFGLEKGKQGWEIVDDGRRGRGKLGYEIVDEEEERKRRLLLMRGREWKPHLQSHKTSEHQKLTSTTANPNPKPEPKMRICMDESLDVKQIGDVKERGREGGREYERYHLDLLLGISKVLLSQSTNLKHNLSLCNLASLDDRKTCWNSSG
ncbi:hypothetical protein PPACK8108_LOCUS16962 [Phakopsora pachyrhizi]|uniref:Uncharacterized protein n=1 Tax=Phakopsora pachyrhizi TaxID=170000 RepID=A0AAV0BCM9_PHAPC|nr:hypothetical protein PPACK8108_LOCUS16962 [Phakopsora pachyrhizi]